MQVFNRNVSARGLTVFTFEVVLISGSMALAASLHGGAGGVVATGWKIAIVTALCQLCFYYNDLYDLTVVHSRSKNLEEITRSADILIAAIGRAHFVKGNHVREGAVVIDVGINRVDDENDKRGYRLVGDVNFNDVAPKAKAITPVPGGVGPMTIAMLMSNTVKAARQAL